MFVLSTVVIVICIAVLFCGTVNATGNVAIALLKYVVAPAALLIAILGIVKCGS